MIKLTKDEGDGVKRYFRNPTKEELENRKRFMDGVVERISKREEIEKEYKKSKTIVKGDRIGRNDPCTCGSGKKYKKCCGKDEN